MTRRLRLWTAALAVMAAGCSGPEAPLAVRVRELPSDVVLGSKDKAAPVAAAVPPLALPMTVPGLTSISLGLDDVAPVARPTATTAPPAPCPTADPRIAPAREAVNSVRVPPAEAVYPFRTAGEFTVAGPNAQMGKFPEAASRKVSDVADLTQDEQELYEFTVTTQLGSLATEVRYQLVTEHDAPGAVPGGLYMVRMASQMADGSTFRFNPVRPMMMLPFPAVVGAEWNATGVDPVSQTALSYTGRVEGRTRVDACGTMLDAYAVRLDGSVGAQQPPAPPVRQEGEGVGASPAGRDVFEALYEFGTQYGALALRDAVRLERRGAAGALVQTLTSTINREPTAT